MNRANKIKYLKDFQEGRINADNNPLMNIDTDNLPCGSVEDLIRVKKGYDYAIQFPAMKNQTALLFEGLIRAGDNVGIVDKETEDIWRSIEKNRLALKNKIHQKDK